MVVGLTALSKSLLSRRFLVNSKWQRQVQKQVQRQGQLFSLRSNVSLLRRRFLFCGMTARRHERFVLALRASENSYLEHYTSWLAPMGTASFFCFISTSINLTKQKKIEWTAGPIVFMKYKTTASNLF